MKRFAIWIVFMMIFVSSPLPAEQESVQKSGGPGKPDEAKPHVENMEETRYLKAWQTRTTPPPPLDRPWIIKLWQEEKTPAPKEPLPPLDWKDEFQKRHCESYLPLLRESFAKARFYSVQGDACRTAEFSQAFLNQVRQCRTDCPEEFLERNGYTPRIERNLDLLLELGAKRCMDIGGSGGVVKSPAKGRAMTGKPAE
jgi:hypothetical protein